MRQGLANKGKTPVAPSKIPINSEEAAKRVITYGRPPVIPQKACKRLNFDTTAPKRNSHPGQTETPTTTGASTPGVREIVFPKSAIQSPFMQARSVGMTPQMAAHYEATPMTMALHIHSWLLECVSSVHKNQQNYSTPSSTVKKSPYTGLSLTNKL